MRNETTSIEAGRKQPEKIREWDTNLICVYMDDGDGAATTIMTCNDYEIDVWVVLVAWLNGLADEYLDALGVITVIDNCDPAYS